jgi:hypothetical protein
MQVNALVQQLPEHKEKIKRKIDDLCGSGGGAFGKFIEMIREISHTPETKEGAGDATAEEKQIIVARPAEPSSFERLISAARRCCSLWPPMPKLTLGPKKCSRGSRDSRTTIWRR